MVRRNGMKIDTAANTFHYVLERHFERNGANCIEYYVMPYCFDEKWHRCFDESRMFATRQEAQEMADKMNCDIKLEA